MVARQAPFTGIGLLPPSAARPLSLGRFVTLAATKHRSSRWLVRGWCSRLATIRAWRGGRVLSTARLPLRGLGGQAHASDGVVVAHTALTVLCVCTNPHASSASAALAIRAAWHGLTVVLQHPLVVVLMQPLGHMGRARGRGGNRYVRLASRAARRHAISMAPISMVLHGRVGVGIFSVHFIPCQRRRPLFIPEDATPFVRAVIEHEGATKGRSQPPRRWGQAIFRWFQRGRPLIYDGAFEFLFVLQVDGWGAHALNPPVFRGTRSIIDTQRWYRLEAIGAAGERRHCRESAPRAVSSWP